MFAIIESGGKQYRVAEGDVIKVEKLEADVGEEVVFERVLMVGKNGESIIGQPELKGARVVGRVVEHGKEKKIVVFKFRRRENYSRKKGHRQLYTAVRIEKIALSGKGKGEKDNGS